MKHRLTFVLSFLLSVPALCAPAAIPSRSVPEVKLADLAGHQQKLSALRGKVVVLSFWATWCAPCREELPRLSKLSASYSGKPVQFLAVSIDEAKDRARIEPFLQQQTIRLDVWTGASTDTMARLGLGEIVPSTIILDEQQQVITRIEGEAQVDDVSSRVDWLLGGRQGPAPAAHLKRY